MAGDDLKFSGVVQTSSPVIDGEELLDYVQIGVEGGKDILVDFLEHENSYPNEKSGVYSYERGTRERLDIDAGDETRIKMLARLATQDGNVTIKTIQHDSGKSWQSVDIPLDMEVVDVNRDGEFTPQDVLNAVSEAIGKSDKSVPGR